MRSGWLTIAKEQEQDTILCHFRVYSRDTSDYDSLSFTS
jgi:hypothetical protein